jgi:hypothetical protein
MPGFNAAQEVSPAINVSKGEPKFSGTLDIRVSPDGKPVSYSLKTKGAPMRVGVNVAP